MEHAAIGHLDDFFPDDTILPPQSKSSSSLIPSTVDTCEISRKRPCLSSPHASTTLQTLEFSQYKKQSEKEILNLSKEKDNISRVLYNYERETKKEREKEIEIQQEVQRSLQEMGNLVLELKNQVNVVENDKEEWKNVALEREAELEEMKEMQHVMERHGKEEIEAMRIHVENEHLSKALAQDGEIRSLYAELDVKVLEIAQAQALLSNDNDSLEESSDARKLRKELNELELTTRKQNRELKGLKEKEMTSVVQQEKIQSLTSALKRAQTSLDAMEAAKIEMEAMTSDRNAFQELLKTNGISTDIQQLMSQSLSKGFTKFHRLVQNDHLEASNTQGKLETRIKLLETRLRESTRRELTETSRCAELDAELATVQHTLENAENKIIYLQKKIKTLESFMETYDNETKIHSSSGDNTGLLLKLSQMETEVTDAQRHIETLTCQQAVSPSPAAFSKYKNRITLLEKELQTREEKVKKMTHQFENMEFTIDTLKNKVLRGEYNPNTTKILHMTRNPSIKMSASDMETLETLRRENAELKKLAEGHQVTNNHDVSSHSILADDAQEAIDSLKKRNTRLMEVFRDQFHKYRTVVQLLTGYAVALTTDPSKEGKTVITLKSLYAEQEGDEIKFLMPSDSENLQLLETPFCTALDKRLFTYLNTCHSIPAFISGVTLHLFENVTFNN